MNRDVISSICGLGSMSSSAAMPATGEPSTTRGTSPHASVVHQCDPVVPRLHGADASGGVGQYQAGDAVGCVDPKPHRRQTTEGDAADVRLLHTFNVEDRQRIATDLLDGVVAFRH